MHQLFLDTAPLASQKILENLVSLLAPVVGIVIILFCVLEGTKLLKGNENGSVKKLISGLVILFFLIGVMYATKSINTWGDLFQKSVNTAVNAVGDTADSILK